MSAKSHLCLGAVVAAAGLFASQPARADSTCTALVTSIKSSLDQNGGSYAFEMTMHRTNTKLVTYSSGRVWPQSNPFWPLVGTSNQLFSDRAVGETQPFNANAADQLTPYIGSTGQLYIHYNTWNFSTQWDMTCVGQTMTQIVPNHGVVTLTFREWIPAVP